MICLFSSSTATSLEEFKKTLYTRIKIFSFLSILGVLTFIASLASSFTNLLTISAFASGFLLGFGISLTVISVIMIIRTRKVLKDEAALKNERLVCQDERNMLLTTLSIKSAAFALLIFLYMALVVSLFINKASAIFIFMAIIVFFLAYWGFYNYFSKRH